MGQNGNGKKRFGTVSVDDVLGVSPNVDIGSRGNEYIADCPFCGKEKHLYIDIFSGKWICHRCKESGTRLDLFGEGTETAPQLEQLAKLLEQLTAARIARGEAALDEPPTDDLWQYRDGKALRYLRSRGLSDGDIQFYGIRLGVKQLSGRVVVVDRDRNDNPLYWTARAYLDDRQRYRNPFGVRKQTVFNLDRATGATDSVVICEGVFSAMRTGRHAVAVYGSQMTREQKQLLMSSNFSRYYVATEPDVTARISINGNGKHTWEVPAPLALAKDLLSTVRGEVFLVELPQEADPADLGPDVMNTLVAKAKPVTRFSLMREKLQCLQQR